MSDKFAPISMEDLSRWVFTELKENNSIFGINRKNFFFPSLEDGFRVKLYQTDLETPFGVAAGPHSQMAQNIISAWLMGARIMELKTVQSLEAIEIAKPCIDMKDAGFNIEWSQELKIHQSFEEYLKAWMLIHALHSKFGFPGKNSGTIFNVSIGYNFEGIQNKNVQWFLNKMRNAGRLKQEYINIVSEYYSDILNIDIPSEISNSLTLSTMHGCPPEEIGKIASYLINEWGFNTSVKLNPTLLGPQKLREILNKKLGFNEITVPDEAFDHDIKFKDAVELITDLQNKADKKGIVFGIKLTNTLEVVNKNPALNPREKMMYMSGRPLYPIALNVAKNLSNEFNGKLLISFSGGADCFNAPDLIRSGMVTVTTSSDMLKPGGFARILQYVENLRSEMKRFSADDINSFILKSAGFDTDKKDVDNLEKAKFVNLTKYADASVNDTMYHFGTFKKAQIKTSKKLEYFDCINAPCIEYCSLAIKTPSVCIRAPFFMELKQMDEAVKKCNYTCENRCMRIFYDEPLALKQIQRYLEENNFLSVSDIPLPARIVKDDETYEALIEKRSRRVFRRNIQGVFSKEINENNRISDDNAKEESARCLMCHRFCSICATLCPNKAVFTYVTQKNSYNLPVLIPGNSGNLTKISEEVFNITQKYQTAVFTPFCNECGTCATFCPTSGSPYKDKPRLYINFHAFDMEENNAFLPLNSETMFARFNNELLSLKIFQDHILCSGDSYDIKLNKDMSFIEGRIKSQTNVSVSMKNFVSMFILLKGIENSTPGYPYAKRI